MYRYIYRIYIKFDLAARDSYFAIQVEVFTKHIVAEKHLFHELQRVSRSQEYGLKTCK